MELCPDKTKRVYCPPFAEYSCYTTHSDGYWAIKNGIGDTVYKFKSDEEYKTSSQSMCDAIHEMYLLLYRKYDLHKIKNEQYYIKSYDEANFPHKAIYKGFEVKNRPNYNSYTNYFGVGIHDAPVTLIRGDKKITISIMYVSFKIGDELVFETKDGVLPSDEFVEKFIA